MHLTLRGMTATDIITELRHLAEPEYRNFAAALIPGEQELWGVRLPALRRLAKKAARKDWCRIFHELKEERCMEAVMLRGMLPGYAPQATWDERLAALKDFVPSIRNWSICDSCCITYKFVREHQNAALSFLMPYLHSAGEYEARFGVVMLLDHFLTTSQQAELVAELLPQVHCSAYYARMAIAWCACELHLRYPTLAATTLPRLHPEVQALTQRKIRESHRRLS